MRTHQTKPNRWSCSITAAAMALNIPVAQLIERLGHDGSEIVFPKLPEPMCRRGFHSQELIHLAWNLGCAVTPIELHPRITTEFGSNSVHVMFDGFPDTNWQDNNLKRFMDILRHSAGVLEGAGKTCRHAVYYTNGMIYNPDGGPIYEFSKETCPEHNFYPQRALVFNGRVE